MNFKPIGISFATFMCLTISILFSYFDLGFVLVRYWERNLSHQQAQNKMYSDLQKENIQVKKNQKKLKFQDYELSNPATSRLARDRRKMSFDKFISHIHKAHTNRIVAKFNEIKNRKKNQEAGLELQYKKLDDEKNGWDDGDDIETHMRVKTTV